MRDFLHDLVEVIKLLIEAFSSTKCVFLMLWVTVCYLAVVGRMSTEQFLSIVTLVFSAFYIQKAHENRKAKEEIDTMNEELITKAK